MSDISCPAGAIRFQQQQLAVQEQISKDGGDRDCRQAMNVHHLELFFYVAKHGGIMPAVRNIPYGIQQPAVSSQMAQLEEYLGATLFQRRPFELTEVGEK